VAGSLLGFGFLDYNAPFITLIAVCKISNFPEKKSDAPIEYVVKNDLEMPPSQIADQPRESIVSQNCIPKHISSKHCIGENHDVGPNPSIQWWKH
jgi:hypothetical protein